MKIILARWYEFIVFGKPRFLILFFLFFLVASGFFATQFRMDASADALILENDQDLRYYRKITAKYGSEDVLFIVYRPVDGDWLSDISIRNIASLRDNLKESVPSLSDVFTLLDAPLINSPRIGLDDLSKGVRTVLSVETDIALARKELQQGIVYGSNLVSEDGEVTAMLLTFKRDEKFFELLNIRNNFRLIKLERELTQQERAQLDIASQILTKYQTVMNNERAEDIRIIRAVMEEHREHAQLFLGGSSMITADMIDFIRKDLIVFGLGILLLLVVTLAVLFRQARWVLLPLLSCSITAIATTGLLGLLDWPITVISSNYVSLLLIITLSMNIHLIVRYRLMQVEQAEATHHYLVVQTMREMGMPCFYMTITTIVAFGSLLVSGIRPVIDFGYIMMCGVALSFIISFVVFPLGLKLLKPSKVVSPHDYTEAVTVAIGRFTLKYGNLVLLLSMVVVVLTAIGITRLEVENRFIDYFKSDTEIHQGMLVIDQKLGGTIPLEIVLDADMEFSTVLINSVTEENKGAASFGEGTENDWLDDYANEEIEDSIETNYWFNSYALERLEEVHDYLETLPEVGKVTSLSTAMKIVRMVNNDNPLG